MGIKATVVEKDTVAKVTPVTKKSVAVNTAALKFAHDYNKHFNAILDKNCPFYGQKQPVTNPVSLLPKTQLAALFLFYGAAGTSYIYALRNNMIEPSTLVKNLAPILGTAIVTRLTHRLCKPYLLKRTANKLFNNTSLSDEMKNLINNVELGKTFNSSCGNFVYAAAPNDDRGITSKTKLNNQWYFAYKL